MTPKKEKSKSTDIKIDLDRISEEIKQVATKIDGKEEMDKLEMEVLRKFCKALFGEFYDSMSKEERQNAFFKLLKRVKDLETLVDLDIKDKKD